MHIFNKGYIAVFYRDGAIYADYGSVGYISVSVTRARIFNIPRYTLGVL